MQASAETIREMEHDMVATARKLDQISERTLAAVHSMSDWDDSHALELAETMKRVAKLTAQPVEQLQRTAPRLEELARLLDEYEGISIGRR